MKLTTIILAIIPLVASACTRNGDCTGGPNGWVGYKCGTEGERVDFLIAHPTCWKGPNLGVGCPNSYC
jgi:hypothetical protein